MTQEEKAKRYDEALNTANDCLKDGTITSTAISYIETIFPELKESEDEKIRKGIIRNLEYLMDRAEGFVKDELKERIAWLEKQGEQKQDPCEHCDNVMLNCHNFPCIKKRSFEQGKTALEAINEEKVDNANKVEPKPTAWSEEDEGILDEIIDYFENGTVKLQHDLSLYASWLKSLKGRFGCEVNCTTTKKWRASWEQLDALQYVCRNFNPPLTDKLGWDSLKTLELMFEQLKKL